MLSDLHIFSYSVPQHGDSSQFGDFFITHIRAEEAEAWNDEAICLRSHSS